MTTGRFPPRALVAALGFITLAACGDSATPCTDCPAMEGRYRMTFGDAGVPGECSQLGVDLPRARPLDIARTGSALTGSLEGVSLRGSVSGEGGFSLSGNAAAAPDGGVDQGLSLSGRFIPPVEDGGTAALEGTYTGNFMRAGPNGPLRCNVITPFSATRE